MGGAVSLINTKSPHLLATSNSNKPNNNELILKLTLEVPLVFEAKLVIFLVSIVCSCVSDMLVL